jgi:iron complex transport system permease protein
MHSCCEIETQRHRTYSPWWLVGILPFVILLGLLCGATGFGLPDIGSPTGKAILWLRWHRVWCGMVVGAALSVSGVMLQAILRNPLAEPYVLGLSGGAGLGAALAILTGFASAAWFSLPLSAFLFACLTLTLVYRLSCVQGRPSVYGLILSGVIMSSICSSIIMFLVSTSSREGMHSVLWWMLGNLQGGAQPLLNMVTTVVVLSCISGWIAHRELDALVLGDEVAHYLGIRTQVAIPALLAIATLCVAAAVSIAGLISFVGLIVPHAARAIVGSNHRRLIPAAAIGGAAFLCLCDALARTLMAPQEIQVGVITSVFGGPFFLLLLTRKRRKGWVI